MRAAPDSLFPELFELVQSDHVFSDSKTFVDAVPAASPDRILAAFRRERNRENFDLAAFVRRHFTMPDTDGGALPADPDIPVEQRIEALWDQLSRQAETSVPYSSLIALPRSYIVPGGRFREVYYWDSYFTMLGLAASGRVEKIADMVGNFAWLIDEFGFIPNGNRTYYCTRSQPPFFSLMVELLSQASGDPDIRLRYEPQLVREYEFWMDGVGTISEGQAHRRVVAVRDGHLNRYWDDAARPRQESYAEDVALAASAGRDRRALYRDIRAAAESGWDFSSRWFADGRSMASIRATSVVPIDLNALLYELESTIAAMCREKSDNRKAALFQERADRRGDLVRSLMFDEDADMFVDLSLPDLEPTATTSLATAFPLFFGIATQEQAARVARRLEQDFLKRGGWATTLADTGQQWDSPNGWAPLQWITFCGLKRYGFSTLAADGAGRWVRNNLDVYRECGLLFEKYNVESPGLAGSGGEYIVQDGFGWTNAVLLRLLHEPTVNV